MNYPAGPWRWTRDELENHTPDRLSDADGHLVVEVTFVPREPVRSILAAAPEMLALLKRTVELEGRAEAAILSLDIRAFLGRLK